MKKLILTLFFVFGIASMSNANNSLVKTSLNNLDMTVNCFASADAAASAAGARWGLSYEEEFVVFERYYWTCWLGRVL